MSCISFNLVISKDFWSLILCIIFILIWTKTKTFYCFKFSNSKLVSILLDLKRNNNTSSKRIGLKYLYLLCKYLHSVYWYAKQNASFSSNICVCLKKILASIFVRHQEMLIKPLNPMSIYSYFWCSYSLYNHTNIMIYILLRFYLGHLEIS